MGMTIGIFGSCVSRDPFSLEAASDFTVGPYVARVSSIGLFDDPLDFDPEWYAHLSRFERRCVELDLSKTAVGYLDSAPLDALVLDFIDERFDLLTVEGTRLSNAHVGSGGFAAHYRETSAILPRAGKDATDAWKQGISRYLAHLAQRFPSRPVILHEAYWASHFRDQDGSCVPYSATYIRLGVLHNSILDEYYRHVKRTAIELGLNLHTIRVRRRYVVGDANHQHSQEPFHYCGEYYVEFLEQLKAILRGDGEGKFHGVPLSRPAAIERRGALLMARAKNEAPYLLEWVCYHKLLGFDEILIYSNESDDYTQELLDELEAQGLLRHVRFTLDASSTADGEMLKGLIEHGKTLPYEWGALLDIDEFLFLHKHANVADLLADFRDADAIAINWMNFGSGGLLTNDGRLTTERFTKRGAPNWSENKWVKSIGRLALIQGGGPHFFYMASTPDRYRHVGGKEFTSYNDAAAIDHSVASIFHYGIRSEAEFRSKRSRGDAILTQAAQNERNRYTDAYFRCRDVNDQECDAMSVHLPLIKAKIAALRSFPRIAELLDLIEAKDRGLVSTNVATA
ncbi:DUF6270 domain-containing protein [Xanthobacter agilis]|uniref:Glycosyl transferase family 2 n=1 Tax=Xanthobacter agilis TaxID=47492 RepID=A0ABU0LK26_XANAG|nr:DUF6270 domain-containing protein [Xanthobacter agilis]MDQ0507492.1 hypothetical protein [Xanthobacter agilis]